jgi:PAS domain S-box-containing protein
LLDAAGEAVLATEPDGTLVYWNEAAEELYGWSEEEVLGRNVLDVTPALGSEERVTEIMERLKAGDSWSGEFSVQRRDGTVFHALVTNTPVRDEHGNLTAIIGVSRDITKLREIQEELERRAGNQWAINEFAIDLASAESVSDLYILIADRLKAITGALAVSVSIYNDDERTLVVKRVAADGGVISRINDMLDREIVGFRTPVGEDTYARMATEIVGTASDLSEVTFGKIPKPLAGAAQRMFGIDRFIGLALTDREDVMGTAVIAFKAGNHSPPEDILQTFARVAAASLRQKQAEEALRASEARFRATFEDAGIGMALVDEQGSVIASNPILQEMLGYSGEVLHGMGFTDFTHPEDRNKDRRQFEALMDGERDAYQMEKRYRRKDGRLIWGRLTASLVRDAAGEPAFAIGMVEDITEQRRIEETLRESERRFRQTFEHAASGMAIIDPDGFFLQVNQRFCDMLGYSCEELVGRGFQEVTHPQDREAALRVFRAQLAGKRDHEQFEKRFIRRDGRAVWTLMSTAMLHDSKGNPLYQISQIQDISKRHEAEKALEQRLAELALLNQIGNQITRPLGLEAVLESAVEIVQRSFGYHHVAILTMNEHGGKLEEKVVLGRFADVVPEGFQMDLDDGLIGWVARHGETVVVNDVEGDPRYINYYPDQILTRSELSVPIRTGGDVVGVLDVQSEKLGAFGEDDVMVMETVADQIAVALENARLYTAERDARRQLRDLASYLQNIREEERTRIAREIHDEFGQMMTALKMDLFWLTKRLPHEETELLRKADAMSDTIDETLENVRRISSELRPGILDDLGLAAAIEWQAETFSERSGIVCELHLDEEGDHLGRQPTTALFRILQEALTNVARHADASRVRVDLTVGPTGVTLTVEDDGRGITQSELADGESLGLMGMRERAHTLGGRVTFEEGPGNGTIVVAQIPRHGQEARPFTSVG